MKQLYALVVLSLVAFGCAPHPTPLRISKFFPLTNVCGLPDEDELERIFVSNGTLDIAPGQPAFFIGVQVSGGESFVQAGQQAAGMTTEYGNRSYPVLKRFKFHYRTEPADDDRTFESAVFHVSIPFDDNGAAYTGINLISSQAAQELMDTVKPGDEVQLFAAVEVEGYMSGDKVELTSGPMEFPLRVLATDLSQPGCNAKPPVNTCPYAGQSYGLTEPSLCRAASSLLSE